MNGSEAHSIRSTGNHLYRVVVTMAHDVFISYAAEDGNLANAACAILEGRRVRCWISPRDVVPGVEYSQAIVTAISGARALVLIFSSSSNASPHVLREVERAVSLGLPILPFRIHDIAPSPALEYFVSASHWLDALTRPMEAHLNRLSTAVAVLLSQTAVAPATSRTSRLMIFLHSLPAIPQTLSGNAEMLERLGNFRSSTPRSEYRSPEVIDQELDKFEKACAQEDVELLPGWRERWWQTGQLGVIAEPDRAKAIRFLRNAGDEELRLVWALRRGGSPTKSQLFSLFMSADFPLHYRHTSATGHRVDQNWEECEELIGRCQRLGLLGEGQHRSHDSRLGATTHQVMPIVGLIVRLSDGSGIPINDAAQQRDGADGA